jgi:hypothetical protein
LGTDKNYTLALQSHYTVLEGVAQDQFDWRSVVPSVISIATLYAATVADEVPRIAKFLAETGESGVNLLTGGFEEDL